MNKAQRAREEIKQCLEEHFADADVELDIVYQPKHDRLLIRVELDFGMEENLMASRYVPRSMLEIARNTDGIERLLWTEAGSIAADLQLQAGRSRGNVK
jgi:phenolic acid decarboxylase